MPKNTIKYRNILIARKKAEKSDGRRFCEYCGEKLNLSWVTTFYNLEKKYFRFPNLFTNVKNWEKYSKNKCHYCGNWKRKRN